MPPISYHRVFEIDDVGHVAIVRFGEQGMGSYYRGEFAELRDDIPWLVEELGRHNVLLDFTGVESYDSRALGLFIVLHRRIQQAQGRLVFSNLPSALWEGFHVTRIDRLIPISPLLESAGRTEILERHFGVTFRPEPFSPDWRTRTVVAVATHLRESRDFSAMPVLADALQDAGCDNAHILDHCRGPGLHARWCPVLELALGRG